MKQLISIQTRGYTLMVEALVAFALFLVAAISFYGLIANVHKAEAKARQTVAATAYAREILEINRALGFTELKLGKSSGDVSLSALRGGNRSKIEMDYTVEVTNGPESGIKSILVEVSWYDGQVSLEGYVGE